MTYTEKKTIDSGTSSQMAEDSSGRSMGIYRSPEGQNRTKVQKKQAAADRGGADHGHGNRYAPVHAAKNKTTNNPHRIL